MTQFYRPISSDDLQYFLRHQFRGDETFDALSEVDAKILWNGLKRELHRMWFAWLLEKLPAYAASPKDKADAMRLYNASPEAPELTKRSPEDATKAARWQRVASALHDEALRITCSGFEFLRVLSDRHLKPVPSDENKRLFRAIRSVQSDEQLKRGFFDPVFLMQDGYYVLLAHVCHAFETEFYRPLDQEAFPILTNGMRGYMLALAAGRRAEFLLFENYYNASAPSSAGPALIQFSSGERGLQKVVIRNPSFEETCAALRGNSPEEPLIQAMLEADAAPYAIGCPALRSTLPSRGNIISFLFEQFNRVSEQALFESPSARASVPSRGVGNEGAGKCPYSNHHL